MNNPDHGRILLITGVMAVGKSTVAEVVANELSKSVHLRGDVFRKMIIMGRVEMSPTNNPDALNQLRMRYELAAITAKRYAEAGFDVVYQDTIIGQMLSEVVALYDGFELHTFVLAPQANIITSRELGRSKTGYNSFSVEQLYELFTEETPKLGSWIDSSDQSPQETAQMILASLR